MIKIIYVSAVFLGGLSLSYASEVMVQSSDQKVGITPEWIGIILLSFIGFIFIARSALQIQKIKKLQKELNTHQSTLSDELDTIGGSNA